MKLALVESCLSEVKANRWKLVEKSIQDEGNKVLEIVKDFHPELDLSFLEDRGEDAKNISFDEDALSAIRYSNDLPTSTKPASIPLSEAVAMDESLMLLSRFILLSLKASVPLEGNIQLGQDDSAFWNLQHFVNIEG